jgi:phage-related protein
MKLRLLIEGAELTLYSIESPGSPSEFLDSLQQDDPDEHGRIWRRLEHLAHNGASRRRDEFRSLGDGLFEAKSRGGARVLFFYDAETRGIVLCVVGILKKKQKMAQQTLAIARQRKKDYETRKERHDRIQILIADGQDSPRRLPHDPP